MPASNELIAFPLLALAVIVLVTVAIAGGEIVRRLVLRLFATWMGPARPELDSHRAEVAPPRRSRLLRARDAGEP